MGGAGDRNQWQPPSLPRPFSQPQLTLTAAHSACEQILENVYPQASYRRAAETQEKHLPASQLQALAVTRRVIEDELRVADGTETVAQRTRAEVSENEKEDGGLKGAGQPGGGGS